MEPSKKQIRAVWPLLKVRVVERTESYVKISFGAEYGSPTTITVHRDMRAYDVREGDLLTLYTEVLIAKPQGSK